MISLKEKVAIVTGAGGSGTGAETARRVAELGARVALVDIKGANQAGVADEIRRLGGDAIAIDCDIADPDAVKAMVDATVEAFGGIDYLHNNAAAVSPGQAISFDNNVVDIDLAVWNRSLEVTLTGAMLACRFAIPHMLKRGGGAIVNMSATTAIAGEGTRVAYACAKGALNSLTRHVAIRYGRQGVRCNSIIVGPTMSAILEKNFSEKGRETLLSSIVSPRLGRPLDQANVVAFLFSDESFFINGAEIRVDGGFLCHMPIGTPVDDDAFERNKEHRQPEPEDALKPGR